MKISLVQDQLKLKLNLMKILNLIKKVYHFR